MKNLSRLATMAILTVGAVSAGFSQANQQNLGSKCGCPSVPSRTTVDIATAFPVTTARGITEFTGNIHLTCDKIYTITNKVYVPAPFSITIDPGTLIQGIYTPTPDNAATLIIERGAQIFANGTADCNIVMTTSNDNLDGTYSISNVSQWGGLVLFGLAQNNLRDPVNTVPPGSTTATYPNGAYPLGNGLNGEGHGEGFFTSPSVGNTFGTNAADPNGFTTPNDHDNSGVVTYLSIRHPGAIVGGLAKGNEINGMTMSSIGDGTTINHVEVVASGDDDFEYFGGTVSVKYMSGYFGDDDKFDYDIGYRGRAQFLFAIAADSLNSGDLHSSDNGVEADADDQFGATQAGFPFQSNPSIWNATFMSNGRIHGELDNTGPAGIQAKEMAGGSVRNSIFVNFRSGLHLAEVRSNTTLKGDGYDQWTNDATDPYLTANGGFATKNALVIQDNVFVVPNDGKHYGFTRGALIGNGPAYGQAVGKYKKDFTGAGGITIFQTTTATGQSQFVGLPTHNDTVQFLTTDRNQIVHSINGIDDDWKFNGSNNGFTDAYYATPVTNLVSASTPPVDGFFTIVNYKGAFDANDQNGTWLSNYGLMSLSMQTQARVNPTDLNDDGVTDINDFSIFIGKFGQKDN